jgi:methyl-accepting chemotaxis protein
MTYRTPIENADQVAELVRALNHQTQPGKDLIRLPGDVYSVVGSLQTAAMRLPQLLDQISELMAHLNETGHLASDTGELGADYGSTQIGLANAKHSADQLYRHLGEAQSGLSSISWTGPVE